MKDEKKLMKAVIFKGDEKLEIRNIPIPKPKRNQVLVKIKTAAICGSDIHFYRSKPEIFVYPDTVSGHEPTGVVYEIGEDVENVKVGDRVCLYHFQGCGTCEHCLSGHMNNCTTKRKGLGWEMDGSNAEYIVMNAENCLILPDELSFEDGTIIACIGATAYSGLNKLNLSGRDVLVVYGLGALGLVCVLMAKAMGATVIGVERNEYRLDFAKKIGADYVINSDKEDIYDSIMKITFNHGADKSIETTGATPLRKMMVKASAVHGTIVMLGFNDGCKDPNDECLAMFDSRYVLRNELTIRGSYVMPIGMYDELVRFLIHKKVKLNQIVTHRFPLDKMQEAIDLFYTGNCGKIIIEV
jgi:2-desacetyl-2-hydroxyethyl bacteriochlorophyllide A dehydrogenase